MTGSSIFDYVHQGDHAEIADQLGLGLAGTGQSGSSTSGAPSPASAGSDDGATNTGTNNPDGMIIVPQYVLYHLSKTYKLITNHKRL